jgi:hypothetical protein
MTVVCAGGTRASSRCADVERLVMWRARVCFSLLSIAERGVQLIATAHGRYLGDLLKNPVLSDLVGGVQSVTLGDEEARTRGTQKSVLERRGPVTFTTTIVRHLRKLARDVIDEPSWMAIQLAIPRSCQNTLADARAWLRRRCASARCGSLMIRPRASTRCCQGARPRSKCAPAPPTASSCPR